MFEGAAIAVICCFVSGGWWTGQPGLQLPRSGVALQGLFYSEPLSIGAELRHLELEACDRSRYM